MTTFTLNLEIPVDIPDDLTIDIVSAVAKDAGFQSTMEQFGSGWLIGIARIWTERLKLPRSLHWSKRQLNGCTCYLQTAQRLPDVSAFVTR
jgi:hypothetical protein